MTADAVKTSAGALHRIPVCRVSSIQAAVTLLQENGIQIVAASEKAADIYTESELSLPSVWSLGLKTTGCHRMSCAVRIRSSVSPRSVLSVRSMSRSLAVSSSMRSCVRQASVLSDSPFIIATLHYAH